MCVWVLCVYVLLSVCVSGGHAYVFSFLPHQFVKEEIGNLSILNTVLLSDPYEYSLCHSSHAHKSTLAITTVNNT